MTAWYVHKISTFHDHIWKEAVFRNCQHFIAILWELMQLMLWGSLIHVVYICIKYLYCDLSRIYLQISNISYTSVSNEIVDNSDVVGATPVANASTTSPFLTLHLALMDWEKNCKTRWETFRFWDTVTYIRGLTVIETTRIHMCMIFSVNLWSVWSMIFNTLRPRQNDRHFADDTFKCTFKCIFYIEIIWISFKISLKFVP